MTIWREVGPPPGVAVTQCAQLSVHSSHGMSEGWTGGWWCPGVPEGVAYDRTTQGRTVVGGTPQTVDELLTQIEASPVVELTTQEQLLTALDELLDNALHGDGCYIDPEDTVCFCVIGKVRAALPRCEETRTSASAVNGWETTWQCLRSAHPSKPNQHYFSEE